jgi:hypothetical protein
MFGVGAQRACEKTRLWGSSSPESGKLFCRSDLGGAVWRPRAASNDAASGCRRRRGLVRRRLGVNLRVGVWC